jgi:hypothetical protein
MSAGRGHDRTLQERSCPGLFVDPQQLPLPSSRLAEEGGSGPKTVLTDVGPVEIGVPRDRQGSFEPQIVRKRQRRLSGWRTWCCRCRPRA